MFRIKVSECFLCIVLLLVSSCSTNNEITALNTRPEENIIQATPSQAPTSEEILALPTAPEPLPAMKTQCASEIGESQDLDLPGVVVLKQAGKKVDFQAADESSQLPNLDFGFYLFDPDKEQVIKSISEGVLEQVSPDGKYVAYVHYDSSGDQKFLVTLDSNGELVNDFSLFLDGGWQNYFNWQNSKQIRIVAAYGTVEARLLDPLTKLHSPLKNDWADAYSPANPYKDKIPDWKFDRRAIQTFDVSGANVLYDPTLTRVFYPKDDNTVSLVNVETEAELANAHFSDWGRIPSWSPDGEYLAIVNHEGNADEFYLISKDGGKFLRITDFSAAFGHVFIPEYSWSPDSRRIVFWLNREGGELKNGAQSELAILDIPSNQITRLCIQGISTSAYEPWTMNHPEPVWSPDGNYIMITQWNNVDLPENYFVLVIDTQTGAVTKISENTAPIGWMIRP